MNVRSGRAEIACSSDGAGDPVLLIHAGVTDRRGWLHLSERLVADHQVVAYDQRGYGETRYAPESYSQVDDAVAVLDAVGLERVAVVGCSMGGGVAIDLALAEPDRVAKLVLIAPSVSGAPRFESYPEPIDGLVQKLEAAESAGDFDELNRLEAWLWLDGPTASEGRVAGPARDLFLEMNGQALRGADPGERLASAPAWDRLDQIAVPTLVLVGELDLPDQGVMSAGAVERIPDARLVTLPGVAHLPHLENDETCLATVTDFLRT